MTPKERLDEAVSELREAIRYDRSGHRCELLRAQMRVGILQQETKRTAHTEHSLNAASRAMQDSIT
jgi:hypothetical protein